MIRHAGPDVKVLRNGFLSGGRLDVSTSEPMATLRADIVGRGNLDLSIGASRTPKRAQLPGHPHRPRRRAGPFRTSVRFVGGGRPLHLAAAARTAATPAGHGADPGPQLDERPGLSFEPTVLGHDETSVGNLRGKDHNRTSQGDFDISACRGRAWVNDWRTRAQLHKPSTDATARSCTQRGGSPSFEPDGS